MLLRGGNAKEAKIQLETRTSILHAQIVSKPRTFTLRTALCKFNGKWLILQIATNTSRLKGSLSIFHIWNTNSCVGSITLKKRYHPCSQKKHLVLLPIVESQELLILVVEHGLESESGS